jgi:hypothetical protein
MLLAIGAGQAACLLTCGCAQEKQVNGSAAPPPQYVMVPSQKSGK